MGKPGTKEFIMFYLLIWLTETLIINNRLDDTCHPWVVNYILSKTRQYSTEYIIFKIYRLLEGISNQSKIIRAFRTSHQYQFYISTLCKRFFMI